MNLAVQVALIASVLIVAAGVLGIALANARNSQRNQTQELYEAENTALGKALDRAEKEVVRLQAAFDEAQKARAVLEETVSGAEAVQKLAMQIAVIHNEQTEEEEKRREEHAAQMVLIKDLIAVVRQSRGQII